MARRDARRTRVDHGMFAVKALLRRRLIEGIRPGTMVDFYAGSGRLLVETAGRFSSVYAVEHDPTQLERFAERLRAGAAREWAKRVEVFPGDNLTFARERLAGVRGLNFLDFDAYGNPHPLIEEVFARFRPEGRAAVAVTDGGRMALLRKGRLDAARYLAAPGPEGRVVRVRPLTAAEYELLVRNFWTELGAARGFRVRAFAARWRVGRRVLYYGLYIEPNRDRMDRGAPADA